MPDLHNWIVQQIDRVEAVAHGAGGKAWHWEHGYGDMCSDPTCEYGELATDDTVLMDVHGLDIRAPWQGAAHIALHDPANVLRRCAADRKILARHRLNPDAYWADAAMCEGCGTEGEMGYAVTENLNDCPELLDLAEAHGLTPEILAGLDRPQEGERPDYPGKTGNIIPDSIASLYGAMYKQVMETTFASISATESLLVTGDPTVEPRAKVIGAAPSDWPTQYSHLSVPEWLHVDLAPEPTPAERAFAVVEPHLSALALYKPKNEEQS